MSDLKTIYLEPAWKLRKTSYIQAFFLYPPEGYKFIASTGAQNKTLDFLSRFGMSFEIQRALARLMPIQLVKSYAEVLRHPPQEVILTYALDHLVLRKEPWILNITFELPWILSGSESQFDRFKKFLRKMLCTKFLRKIIFPIEIGREAFLQSFGEEFRETTEIIPEPIIPKEHGERNHNKNKLRLLFINTVNIKGDYIFYIKGGAEVVEAFLMLQERYKDDIELVLRTSIPGRYKEKLSRLKNVKIIENPISWEELEKEWKSADIFVHPHHGNMSHTLLEALSYGLPVVTTDTWATSELVEDGKTGFLVYNPRAVRFTDGALFHFDNPQYTKEVMNGAEPEVVKGLVEKLSILIENPDLRKAMGEAGRREIESRKHSIKTRNEKLKRILDEATA